MNRSFLGGGAYFYIDASDFFDKVTMLKNQLSTSNFNRLLNRTFHEVGQRAKTPIAREIQKQYVVTQAWVKSQMKSPQYSNLQLRIPLTGHKGSIGRTFHASGGRRGRRRVKAKIVRTGISTLPNVMVNQGGNPPFMVNGVTFTRRTAARFPIVAVKGLAVPQMPLNRSADDVADTILAMADARLEHNFNYMFKA